MAITGKEATEFQHPIVLNISATLWPKRTRVAFTAFFFIIIIILVIWHYWPDTVCTPDTMGTSESNATLVALVLHLMTLSPRGSFWHRRFPTIHCLLCVCSSSKGENNLEFNHISRSLTFGKRIMSARSR